MLEIRLNDIINCNTVLQYINAVQKKNSIIIKKQTINVKRKKRIKKLFFFWKLVA